MKAIHRILMFFISIIVLAACSSNDDEAGELDLKGTWFLIQSCNSTNQECTTVVKGNYSLNFNEANKTVVIEKEGRKFPPAKYEIKRDKLGSWLIIDEYNRGLLLTLNAENLVLRSRLISVLPPDPGTKIHYYIR